MSDDEVLLKFTYGEKDFAHVTRMRLTRAARGRLDLAFGAVILVVGSIVAYAFAPAWMWHLAVFFLLVVILAVGSIVGVSYFIIPGMIFRRDPRGKVPLSYEFSDAGVTVTSGDRRAAFKWKSFSHFDDDVRVYVLYFAARGGYTIIPRRVFRDEAQEATFRKIVEQFVPRGDDASPDREDEDDA